MNENPFTNGGKPHRDSGGRFLRGGPGGPGRPSIADAHRRRAEFFSAIRSDDIELCLRVLRDAMENGSTAEKLAACREFLNRILGTPAPSDLMERVEQLEARMEQKQQHEPPQQN